MRRNEATILGLVLFPPPPRYRWLRKRPARRGAKSGRPKNKRWIACHLMSVQNDKLDIVKRLVSEGLAPLGFNALILEVDYSFQFTSHPELETRGLNKIRLGSLPESAASTGSA